MSQINLGPARFLDQATTSAKLLALVGRIDPISIWCTVLVALGFAAAGKVEKGKAFAAAGTMWAIATLFAVASA